MTLEFWWKQWGGGNRNLLSIFLSRYLHILFVIHNAVCDCVYNYYDINFDTARLRHALQGSSSSRRSTPNIARWVKILKKSAIFLTKSASFCTKQFNPVFWRKDFSQLGTCHTLLLRFNCIIWANTYTQIFFSLMITFVNSYQYDLVFRIYSDIFISAIFSRHFKNV